MHGRVAVVTGAAGGIGSAVVHELRARGAIVSAWDLSEPEGGQHNLEVDVTDESAVIAAAGAVADGVGRPEILVNCAAWLASHPLLEMPADTFRKVQEVNVLGTFLVTREIARLMQGGAIVNFGSIAGFGGGVDTCAYAASKGAVVSFTYAIAQDLAPRGIRVNAICPGWIDAGFTKQVLQRASDPAAVMAAAAATHLLGRMGTAQEVAKVVAFLVSEDASFITGTAFFVDGGFMVKR
jgi:NAD(P)-dependent dehydrogenase (short-subunit alcohol dehydrogenase family)